MKIMRMLLVLLSFLIYFNIGIAQANTPNNTIIFVPQDNRPISFEQTAENIRLLGYHVLTPPEEYLGNRVNPYGEPENLTKWLKDNAKKASFAVISSDSVVYGSLVASRIHHFDENNLKKKVELFRKLKEINPSLNIYVFSSIMRTPQNTASAGEDAATYVKYAGQIARLTALKDKKYQLGKLNRKDNHELKELEKNIPKKAIESWMHRRKLNFDINKELINLLHENTIDYLALGADDNAPYSQTNLEKFQLDKFAGKMFNYKSVPGIDEIAYILLARTVNNLQNKLPFITTKYAIGVGKNTIPAYANEKISKAVNSQIQMAGALEIKDKPTADLILYINTLENGTTGAANNPNNTIYPTRAVDELILEIKKDLAKKRNISIGDISFANGSDNSLMHALYQNNLLDKIRGYAGWNTPTNSSGYAIAMGMTAPYTNYVNNLKMLEMRYLDDWLYQANIRQEVANKLDTLKGIGTYSNTETRTIPAQELATIDLQKLIKIYYLDKFQDQEAVSNAQITFPWHRMFEAKIIIPYAQ